jgi:hypothetical protein
MTLPHLFASPVASRRDFLRKTGCGLGTLAGFSSRLVPLAPNKG